jgi:hypothetical protein
MIEVRPFHCQAVSEWMVWTVRSMRERQIAVTASIVIVLLFSYINVAAEQTREDVPPPPQNVEAIPLDGSIRIEWEHPPGFTGNDLLAFSILKGKSESNITNIIESPGPFVNSFTDDNVVNGQEYFYTVKAINESGSSPASSPVSAIPRGPASPPLNFSTDYESETVHLSWKEPDDENGSPIEFYSVFKGPDDLKLDTRINVSMEKEYTDRGLVNGVKYYYQVCAVTAAGDGRRTVVKGITPKTVPNAPFNLTSVRGDGSVTLRWNYSLEDGGTSIIGHRIFGGTDLASLEQIASIGYSNTYTVEDLDNGVEYYFSVSAFNSEGESEKASATTETPLGPQRCMYSNIR